MEPLTKAELNSWHHSAMEMSPMLALSELKWSQIYALFTAPSSGFSLISALSLAPDDDTMLTEDLLLRGEESDTHALLSSLWHHIARGDVLGGETGIWDNEVEEFILAKITEKNYFNSYISPWGTMGESLDPLSLLFSYRQTSQMEAYRDVLMGSYETRPWDKKDTLAKAATLLHPTVEISSIQEETPPSAYISSKYCPLLNTMRSLLFQFQDKSMLMEDPTVSLGVDILLKYMDIEEDHSLNERRSLAISLFNSQEHFTPQLVSQFHDSVEEYNLEWAMASFDWAPGGSKVIRGIQETLERSALNLEGYIDRPSQLN